jgi:diguanylate cyclase (GGDEF)-like protein/putative nucleotidyltransferase with HDIG domain
MFNFINKNIQENVLWSLLAISILSAFGFAIFQVSTFGGYEIAAMLLISGFIITYQALKFRLLKVEATLWIRELTVFFGAIWLGVFGAILFGFVAILFALFDQKRTRKRTIALAAVSIFSSFLSCEAFYLFLRLTSDFNMGFVGLNPINPLSLILGVFVMGTVYCLVNYAMTEFFITNIVTLKSSQSWHQRFKQKAINVSVGLLLSLALYPIFVKVGVSFGAILFPFAMFGLFAFRFHRHVLSQKISEIEESSRIHFATVEALAIAIDARDQLGEDHVRRVQVLAVGLGEAMSLSDDDLKALRTGALLHDIGKLAIPDHILSKPGGLTPAEMEKMKIHPSVGASILEKINFNNPVVSTVKHHHEAWDGSGYPDKLKGEKIPLTARVLTIADAYDTLRGVRPYRLPLSKAEARKLLLGGAGVKFDPKLIDVFLRNLHSFEAEINALGLSYSLDSENSNSEIDQPDNFTKSKHGYVEQIKSANKEVFTLYELAKIFTSSLNLQETFELFSLKVGELVPFDTFAIYIYDETKGYATAKYVDGENEELLKGLRVKPSEGESGTGFVLHNKKPFRSISPAIDFTSFEQDEVNIYTSMASLPLLVEDRLVGVVTIYSADLDGYEEEHMRLLETISKIAAEAISKALYHAETETKALTDPMTNLPNARSLQIQFDAEVARTKRTDRAFQLVMLDLDGFKLVNDTFGHKAGDALLREVSKVMRGQLRDYDFLARYAGDEFVALIPETTNSEIDELVQRIEQAVHRFALPISEGKVARVGVSIGHASYPNDGEILDQVLIAADTAMYAIKAIRKQKQNRLHQEDLRKSLKPAPNPPVVAARPKEDFPVVEVHLKETPTIIVPETAIIFELDESHIVSDSVN